MRFACRINKATNTHSVYIILTAFLRQKWLREWDSMLMFTRTLPVILFPVLHTVYDKNMNVISFMSRRKGRPSQHRISLHLLPRTEVRVLFFTDPNRTKNTGKIWISALSNLLLSLQRFSWNSLFNCFYVVIFCTKFNQNRSRNMWSVGRINYSLRKIS